MMFFKGARKLSGQLANNKAVVAVILDWSGTTADAHVIGPAVVFHDVFKKAGVSISMEEAREPMGLRKDLHIYAITQMPAVQKRWHEVHGKFPDQADVDKMFAQFVPEQLKVLPQYTTLIDGTVTVINKLQSDGIKVGSTTGFTSEMVDILLHDAKQQGYEPDVSVAGDDVLMPRPYPFMLFKNIELMLAKKLLLKYPDMAQVVKVDDTVSGVGEGHSAGCWTVGVYGNSNYTNINSLDEAKNMSADELKQRQQVAKDRLIESGADFIAESVTGLPTIIRKINRRLEQGQRPGDVSYGAAQLHSTQP